MDYLWIAICSVLAGIGLGISFVYFTVVAPLTKRMTNLHYDGFRMIPPPEARPTTVPYPTVRED